MEYFVVHVGGCYLPTSLCFGLLICQSNPFLISCIDFDRFDVVQTFIPFALNSWILALY